MFFTADLITKAEEIIRVLKKHQMRLCFAESCTGGLFAALITEVSGAGEVLDHSLVTYSEAAKIKLLGVNAQTIKTQDVVSAAVAEEMARGCILHRAEYFAIKPEDFITLAVTGYAGSYFESNAENDDPNPGLVYISSFNTKTKKIITEKFTFDGDRFAVRKSTLMRGLELILANIK